MPQLKHQFYPTPSTHTGFPQVKASWRLLDTDLQHERCCPESFKSFPNHYLRYIFHYPLHFYGSSSSYNERLSNLPQTTVQANYPGLSPNSAALPTVLIEKVLDSCIHHTLWSSILSLGFLTKLNHTAPSPSLWPLPPLCFYLGLCYLFGILQQPPHLLILIHLPSLSDPSNLRAEQI